jgi:hypothetical protein
MLKDAKTPCEMEQLSSLPQNCAGVAKSLQIPLRIYVPFGHASLPYDIWQVRARPQIVAWVLRDAVTGKHRHLSPDQGGKAEVQRYLIIRESTAIH